MTANNGEKRIEGIDFVKIRLYDGSVKTLGNVRYVPDFSRNLISLGKLVWVLDILLKVDTGVLWPSFTLPCENYCAILFNGRYLATLMILCLK